MIEKKYKKAISSSIILIFIFTTILISLGDRAFAGSRQSNSYSTSSHQSNSYSTGSHQSMRYSSGSHQSTRHSDARVMNRTSPGYREARGGGQRYYYHHGGFNMRGATALFIGGITYYLLNDLYYRELYGDYWVVGPPPPPLEETVVVNEAIPVTPSEENVGEQVTVTAPLLNIRSGPGMDFPVVTQAHEGDIFTVEGYASGWLYVKTSTNEFGWVMTEYTSSISPSTSGATG